ncbi:ankyrin repeat domain-containing protein [Bosea sp. LjRoot90]|uniref:ankyrin repeat domain-containing protein n=1 Tax=Bosea sp. LjRoot90 TaxID=3342342 RepID=UPI003ECF219E
MADAPPLDPELVKDFVRSAHGKLDRVEALIADHPTLVNAAWDWGGGDWESGLGAAAHTGRRDIADFLLARGARMDIFAAAMLGHLDLVRTYLSAVPTAVHAGGPHGIPLITHAKMGGAPAAPVLDYLQELLISSAAAGSAKNG